MAWSIVGVGSVVEVTATTHTLTEPAGCASGDLLVACISSRIASTTSITLPTGGAWTLVNEQKANNTTANTSGIASGLMAYAIRGASTPNLTFTHPIAPTVALGRIVAYRGNATTTPLDVNMATTTATAVTSVSVPGLTTTLANDLIVAMVGGGQEAAWSSFNATTPSGASGATDTTTAPSATWRERADSLTTTGADTSLAIFDALKTAAGATGNLTATGSVGGGNVVIAGAFKILAPINVSVSVTGQSVAAVVDTATAKGGAGVTADSQSVAVSVGTVSIDAITAPYFGPRSYAVAGPLGIGYVWEDSSRSYSTHYGFQVETAEEAPTGDVTTAVTGHALTVSVGDVTVGAGANVSVPVDGQAIAVSVGEAVASGGIVVPVTGQAVSAFVGEVSVAIAGAAIIRFYAVGGPLGAGYVYDAGDRAYSTHYGYQSEPAEEAAPTGDVVASLTGQSVAVSMGAVTVSAEEMAGVGVWNGSAWVDKPAKVWNGSAWVQKPVKHWNGSAWV